jgi:hypothetical protein
LMSAAPQRPCEDVGEADAALSELEGDATNFLN